jgi:hypothetical protein
MLRWSAENTTRSVDIRAVADPSFDAGLPGGAELIALATSALGTSSDADPAERLADVIGRAAAVDAAAVAAAFESFNRVVDGTGLPVTRGRRQQDADIIQVLGLERFPHAAIGRI